MLCLKLKVEIEIDGYRVFKNAVRQWFVFRVQPKNQGEPHAFETIVEVEVVVEVEVEVEVEAEARHLS